MSKAVGREEFAAVRRVLREKGMDDLDIGELEALVAEGSLTWAELLQRVQAMQSENGVQAAELDLNEQRRLQVLLQKIGIPAQEAEALATSRDRLSPEELHNRILQALEKLPEDAKISVDAGELGILARALGMPGEQFALVEKVLSSEQGEPLVLSRHEVSLLGKMLGEGCDSILERLSAETTMRPVTVNSQEAAALRNAMSSGFAGDARLLAKLFDAAGEHTLGGDALRMLVTLTGQGRERILSEEGKQAAQLNAQLNAIRLAGSNQETVRAEAGPLEAVVQRFAPFGNAQGGRSEGSSEGAARERFATAAGEGESGAKVEQQARDLTMSGKGGEDSFGQGRARDGADDLWSKVVQTRSDQSPGAQIKTAPVHQVSPEAAATQGQTLSPAAARADLQAAAVNRGVYRMVESGIFQNLGQGRRQLTLRLSPPELGSLSVMLQVRNKDVQAVIRTSSDEAGRIVGEQLAQLRQSLESQGLKVSRLEVQTQLKDGPSSQGWMGADGHNQAREQQFETLSWVRRWLGTRQAEGDETAQGVQSSLVMEQISSDGLDIFA